MAAPEVCRLIAQDCGQAIDDVAGLIAACWPRLIEAGLVQAKYDRHGATP